MHIIPVYWTSTFEDRIKQIARTKYYLYLFNTDLISSVFDLKQANVYHARTANGESRAIKIYKTSILVFKDRDKYVSGEFR